MSNFEDTLRSVNGLACDYTNLVAYGADTNPGIKFDYIQAGSQAMPNGPLNSQGKPLPSGAVGAVDVNGNPLYDSLGNQLLVDARGNLIPLPMTMNSVCGAYAGMNLAYGL